MITYYQNPPTAIDHPDYDERIKLAVEANDVGTICLTFISIIQENPDKNFSTFEHDLRRMDLLPYLIAVPASQAPNNFKVRWIDGSYRDFSLWICLYGRAEAIEKLNSIGVQSFSENLKNLSQAGVLSTS